MKTVLLAALLTFFISENASSQSCLWLDTVHVNPDSTYFDTCVASVTLGGMFCRRHYILRFDWYVMATPNSGYDTAIYHWTDIDTSFPAMRAAFANLEDSVGPFTLKKRLPLITDSASRLSHSFVLRFDSLVNVDSALGLLRQIPNMMADFGGFPRYECSDECLTPGLDFETSIALDHSIERYTPSLHPLGWQWSIYKLKCPMAWEITKGNSSIHIIGCDDFNSTNSLNPDLIPNFIKLVATTPGSHEQSSGDGYISSTLKDAHGHHCISQAIAAEGGDLGPMVGTCPNCTGIALDHTLGVVPDDIDVDGIPNNHNWTVPEIEWSSSPQPTAGDFFRMMGEGIAIFAAGGNALGFLEGTPPTGLAYPEALKAMGYTTFISGGSNPAKDVHPLGVAPTMDGIQLSSTCVSGVSNVLPDGSNIRCIGAEQFRSGYTFSGGLEKFSVTSDTNTRKQKKGWAFVDVVAPGELLIYATAAVPGTGTAPGYEIGGGSSFSAPLVAGIAGLMRSVNYYVKLDGSSPNSAPTDLADVQRNLNDAITFTADKIHDYDNSAYNPTGPPTYPDGKGFPSDPNDKAYKVDPTSGVTPLDVQYAQTPMKLWQYDYVNQGPNDPLNRSWAQRVGFGRVNAYRAVANSIPFKADLLYQGTDLDFTSAPTNEDGKKLMHMGGWRIQQNWSSPPSYTPNNSHRLAILDSGGVVIPNQTSWIHCNQGQTFLKLSGGAATVLTVGDNDILAIDGLVCATGAPGYNHKITTSTYSGKILITGYLQDVEINAGATGPVKIDDLIIYSDNAYNFSKITVGSNHDNPSEVYGIVHLQDNGQFIVNGYLTIQPGGEIDMDGNKDFEIPSGGIVTMEASSKIASSAKSVIVDGGAQLFIDGLLPVDILCLLHVKNGGVVTIRPGAHLRLDQFLIDKGGTLTALPDNTDACITHSTCLHGGRLTLNKKVYSRCFGNFIFVGSANSRCIVTGGLSPCGSVVQTAGIIVQGSTATSEDPALTLINMQYTDDSDVGINVYDARKMPFDNDHFSINSSFNTDPWWAMTPMLEIWNSTHNYPPFCGNDPLLIGAVISNSHFFDEEGAWVTTDGGTSYHESQIATGLHNASCLLMYNLYSAWVHDNKFYNAKNGCWSDHCMNITYRDNTFGIYPDGVAGQLEYGIMDHNSGALYCSNKILNCAFGGLGTITALNGTLHDNIFANDTFWCLMAQSVSQIDLRSNSFSSYQGDGIHPNYGAWSVGDGSVINLTDVGTTEYGKNIFDAGSVALPLVYDLVRQGKTVGGGDLFVKCGLNYFGKYSQYHAVNLSSSLYPLDVSYNMWDNVSTPAVRQSGMSISGTPKNTSATVDSSCDLSIDWDPACGPATSTRIRNETWHTIDRTSTVLKNAFWSASAILLADTSTTNARRIAAVDEFWAASLMDSSSTYMPLALADFTTVAYSATAPAKLRSAIWLLKGNLHEMLAQTDSATISFTTIVSGYHQFSDSIYAQWGLQRVVIPSDTLMQDHDSAINAYTIRIHNDLLAMMDTAGDPAAAYKTSSRPSEIVDSTAAYTIRIHPNPTSTQVLICVDALVAGEPFVAEVVSVTGEHIATLYDATPEAELGLCQRLDCTHLAPGTYYVRVANSTQGRAVKFSVAR